MPDVKGLWESLHMSNPTLDHFNESHSWFFPRMEPVRTGLKHKLSDSQFHGPTWHLERMYVYAEEGVYLRVGASSSFR